MSGFSESGLLYLPAKISAFSWSQATLRSLTLGLSLVLAGATDVQFVPEVSGYSAGTYDQGWKFSWGGLLVKTVLIGVAVRSNWFMGVIPRICSMVRVMLTCVR